MNGNIFWYTEDKNVITSFDLAEGVFRLTPGPNRVQRGYGSRVLYLFEFEGCLCLADSNSSCHIMDLWMLKHCNINNPTWVRMASVSLPSNNNSWMCPRSVRPGELLLARGRGDSRTLYMYSLLTRQFDTLEIVGLPSSNYSVIDYEKNFISLNAL
ncbi:hypothetical protein ACHQM5_020116 [Ranunculus cassubicifolius]